MAERKYIIKTPAMCEYIFHVLMNTSKEVIRELSIQEQAYFKSAVTMRRFADNESWEKTSVLLARIHVPTFTAIGNRRGLAKVFEDVHDQFEVVNKRKDLIQYMASEKIFVVCSNELMLYGQLASQNSHSKVYQLNADYVKIHQKISDTGRSTANEDIKDSAAAFEMMSTAILQSVMRFEQSQAMIGVPPHQLKILLALFRHQDTFVTPAKLCEVINEGRRVRGMVKCCTIMERSGLVASLVTKQKNSHKSWSYTLTEKGVKVAMDFIGNIAKTAYYG